MSNDMWTKLDESNQIAAQQVEQKIKDLVPGIAGGLLYHAVRVVLLGGTRTNLSDYDQRCNPPHIQRLGHSTGTWRHLHPEELTAIMNLVPSCRLAGRNRTRYAAAIGLHTVGA